MRKIFATLSLIIIIIVVASIPCFAVSTKVDEYDYYISKNERIAMLKSYTCAEKICNFNGSLKNPQDLFIDTNGIMYIADTGNNRLVISDLNGNVKMLITEAEGKTFESPAGVFVDDEGSIYLSDTGNGRIVHLAPNGNFIESFVKPKSEMLGKTYVFNPTKLVVSDNGYIYTIKSQAIMTIDAQNEFRGFLGQAEVGYNFFESFARMVASEEQIKSLRKRQSDPYLNITLANDGLIYATSRNQRSGEIVALNSVGENVFVEYASANSNIFNKISNTFNSLFDIGNYAADSFVYGERLEVDGKTIDPLFVDITVSDDGIVTVVEENTGMCYQYDSSANLLTAFGGKGKELGKFEKPTAIASTVDGEIIVLDASDNSIQKFSPTDFIKNVHQAVSLYSNAKYDEAKEKWVEILKYDENYDLAHIGIGKAYFKQGKYESAMSEYKLANNRRLYSQAYAKQRHIVFRKNFGLVVIGATVVITVIILLFIFYNKLGKSGYWGYRKNRSLKKKQLQTLSLSFNMLYHPIDTLTVIRENRDTFSTVPAVILITVAVVWRILSLSLTSYPMMAMDTRDINLGIEIFKIAATVISWSLASFWVSSVLDGESKFKEILLSSSYSMMPFIVLQPLITASSAVLSQNEAGFYNAVQVFMWLWILLLFFLQIMMLNDYSLNKAVLVSLLSIIAMLLIWAICFLVLAIVGELWNYLSGIVTEIRLILL